jgi:[ribosomal protein S18]-alanine N-acetyltransferase
VRIRRANTADVPALMALERQSPAAAHWSRQQYQTLFVKTSSEQQSERIAWIAEDDGPQPEHGSRETPEILAFLIAHRVNTEWELENIVVAATARRRGIGKRLLAELVEHVRSAQGREILLEVRESNQDARALYSKTGFEETGLRRSYYSNPPEDAILCSLRLY